MKPYAREKKAFALISLLLAAVIICILYYIAINTYFKRPSLDKPTEKFLSEQGIDASSYQSVIDSAREGVGRINRQTSDYEKQLKNFK